MDANHYVPRDDLTADEWADIQADIAVWDEAEGYVDDEPSPLDAEKYDSDVITLPAGTILMRYGDEHGTFLTDPGTTIDQCALPRDQYEVSYYLLNEPMDVHAGTASPWFGKEGGGAQYKTIEGKTPLDLIDSGVFSRCDVDGNRLDAADTAKPDGTGADTKESFFQAEGGKVKGSISDFVQKHAQVILGACAVVQMLGGAAQLKIDMKKVEAEIEPLTKIEQISEAFDDFQEKVADDDVAATLEKSNEENTDMNESGQSIVIEDAPDDADFIHNPPPDDGDDPPKPPSGGDGKPPDNPPPPPGAGDSPEDNDHHDNSNDGGGDSPDNPPKNDGDGDRPDDHREVIDRTPSVSGSADQTTIQATASEPIESGDRTPGSELSESQLFSTYEDRIKHTPSMESGRWEGERGESLCTANSAEAQEILDGKGLSGIEYHDGIPDFSPLSESTVQLGYMTDARHNSGTDGRDGQDTIYVHYGPNGEVESSSHHADQDSMSDLHMKYDKPGNFEQADILTAQSWSEEKKDDHEWTAQDVAEYRQTNNLTWHECNDGSTMMLIPKVINSEFGHLGGVSEIKAREEIVAEAIRGTEFDVEEDNGDPTQGMTDAEVADYFEKLHAEQDRYNEGQPEVASSPDAPAVQQTDPVDALAQYYSDHGYGPDDASVYQNDPEWQQLQKAAYPDYEMPQVNADKTTRTETVDASSIQGVDTSDPHFWDHHNNSREDYLALANKLPEVQDQLAQGKTLEEIEADPELRDCAIAYYDPDHMVKVEQTEHGLEFSDDGRHRIAAAQELGLQIPVQVVERNPDAASDVKPEASPITADQQAAAFEALGQYMSDHHYGREDYAEYSQDPEWQVLHDAAYGHPVIESSESTDSVTDKKLDEIYRQNHAENGDGDQPPEDTENGDGDQPPEDTENGDVDQPPEDTENGEGDQPSEDTENGDGDHPPEDTEGDDGDQPPEDAETGDGDQPPEDTENGDGEQPLEDTEGNDGDQPPEDIENGDGEQPPESTENGDGDLPLEDTEDGDGDQPPEDTENGDGDQLPEDIENGDGDQPPEDTEGDDGDQPPEDIENGDGNQPPEDTEDADQVQSELAGSDDEYEQMSIEGFDDVDLSDELGTSEDADSEALDGSVEDTSVDMQEELGENSEIEGQMSIDDLDGSLDTSLGDELSANDGGDETENTDEGLDVSELEDGLDAEDADFEQLSLEGFDDEELESIGSEEAMDELDGADSNAGISEQMDGQMSIDDIPSSIDSAPAGGGDSGDGGIS